MNFKLEGHNNRLDRWYGEFKSEIIHNSLTKNRTIYIYDEIDDDMEIFVNYAIEKLCREERDGKKLPIKIKINTDGGQTTCAFSIVSTMSLSI